MGSRSTRAVFASALLGVAACVDRDPRGGKDPRNATETAAGLVSALPRTRELTQPYDCHAAGPVVWELVETPLSFHGAGGSVGVARVEDTTGDGRVDLNDDVRIASGSEFELVWLFPRTGTITSAFALDLIGGSSYAIAMGDVDGRPGAELVAAVNLWSNDALVARVGADSGVEVDGGDYDAYGAFLADVGGDGFMDLLTDTRAVQVSTGSKIDVMDPGVRVHTRPIAADLDLDGVVEVLGAEPGTTQLGGRLGRLDSDGTVPNPCLVTDDHVFTAFGVGNLDDDPEGEFVLAIDHGIAICDTDSSLVRSIHLDTTQPNLIGIGDLDGDGRPEVLTAGNLDIQGPAWFGAWDLELNLLWEKATDMDPAFSLADLDADGSYEVVYQTQAGVAIADGDGTDLASWGVDEPWGANGPAGPHASPIVVDVDGDGLSEIVVPRGRAVNILTTPNGGFPVAGGDLGWSGNDHYPGRMRADGTLDRAITPWLYPGGNAWQAHPVCIKAWEQ